MFVILFATTTGSSFDDAEKMEQQRETAAKEKREAAEAEKAKREEQAKEAKRLAEAKKLTKADIEKAKQLKKQSIAQLDKSAGEKEFAAKKKQIEAEYALAVAKINMKLRLQTQQGLVQTLTFAKDTSQILDVKEVTFSGNTLVTTAELLEQMPIVFNSSKKPLSQAGSENIYDFTPLFEVILNPGQPQKISARTIRGFTQYILSVYKQKNYAGIYVYVPAEALKSGKLAKDILPVEIIEALVTDVEVKQYDVNQAEVEKGYLDANAVLAWSPVKEDKVANAKKLDDFVNLLNQNPDRYVSAMVSKGSEPKTLAVQYEIYEVNPWHWFLQIDNSGTDDRQWSPRLGVINSNLLGYDDTFTAMYQAKMDSGIDENYLLYGSYDFPIWGPKLRMNVYGGYSEFDVSPEAGDIDFIGSGKFIGADLRYNVFQTDGWFVDLIGSYSHEESKITPFLVDISIPEGRSDVTMDIGGFAIDLHKFDDVSNASLGYKFSANMGGSSQNEFNRSRPPLPGDVDKYFTIHQFYGSYSRLLDPNKVSRLNTTLRWIVTKDRLPPAKMTSFGGMYSIRGYDEYDVIADGGLIASLQYEFDIVKYQQSKDSEQPYTSPSADSDWQIKKFAPLAFLDYGLAKIEDPNGTTEDEHQTLASVGIGLIVEVGDNLSGVVYCGYPLKETENTREGKGRLNAGFMLKW